MKDFEDKGKGVVKRRQRRILGLFIDGVGLDRATRRINRKVDMSALVRGVTSGIIPTAARYYTLIPNEDDSRQRAFLDAVSRAGLDVIVKRLPPKGVNRQVAIDVEMASDIVAFAQGHSRFSKLGSYEALPKEPGSGETGLPQPGEHGGGRRPILGFRVNKLQPPVEEPPAKLEQIEAKTSENSPAAEDSEDPSLVQRIITVVCPSRDLAYPISLARELGVDTISADFGQLHSGDVLKSAAKWIDLSDSETIWRE